MKRNPITPLRLLLLALAFVTLACGSETEDAATTATNDAETSTETDANSSDSETPPANVDVTPGTTDEINGGKPTSISPNGDAPTALGITDLVVGDGEAAQPGDLLVMHYVGVLADGTEFDASWNRGDTFSFPLGQGRVIQGWDEGIVDMQEGGRRVLAIPSEQAYGSQSPSPDIPADSPLYFVVDLVSTITPPTVENESEPATELSVTVIEEGDGDTVEVGDVVEIHFTAIMQEDGQEIGSTFVSGQPAVFEVGAEPTQLIEGFDQAVAGHAVGSWLRVIVPPELGLPDPESSGLPAEPTIVAELLISNIR